MTFVDRVLFRPYLEPKEEIQYVIHRHWVLVYRTMAKIVTIGWLLPLAALFFFVGFATPLSYFLYGWFSLGALFLLYNFLDWYGDAWVLTNERIIEVRWDGLFTHSAITLDFHNMLDVEYQVDGLRQRLFGYGTLSINKYAGQPIEVTGVAKPKLATIMISKLRMAFLAKHRGRTDELKQVLEQIIADRPDDYERVQLR